MDSDKFLRQVARYYYDKRRSSDLADIIFVLPNKRSAMFLKRYMQQLMGTSIGFMPRFTTFGKFLARRSKRREPSRNDKLFTLYTAYKNVLATKGRADMVKGFDKFVFWGDMILNDFEQIDRSLASADKLYTNLRKLREITADYLSDEQKSAIRDIWGETSMTRSIDSFWHHNRPDSDKKMTSNFIALWQVLAEVYAEFNSMMDARGLATSGMQARLAVEQVYGSSAEALRSNHFVFVGHIDLSFAEIKIMRRLRDINAADFFWDRSSPFLIADVKGKDTEAMSALDRLAREFPEPADFTVDTVTEIPNIEVIGIPSAIGQAKVAADVLSKLADTGALTAENAIETAVVLPDQSLLTSLMLAMPQSVEKVNVTMTVPFSSTTFATLLRVIVSLQMRSRVRSTGEATYFFKDVLEVLLHPHIQLIAPEECEKIRKRIMREKLYNLNGQELVEAHPSLAYIFQPVASPRNADTAYNYLAELIDGLSRSLAEAVGAGAHSSIELTTLSAYRTKLDELRNLVAQYGIEMADRTFFILFERIINSDSLPLTGTPLEGLQVMGVLETRALDFDNVIILSMNENTFPRRDYVKTMIPNNLRRDYGLPPIERTESFYSYYFMRAIGRAKRVTLIYDSRSGHSGSGEISRYVNQLFYLDCGADIKHYAVETAGNQPDKRVITVEKTPEVMAELSVFHDPLSKRNVSATAIKTYLKCPLDFYLTYVKSIRPEDEPEGFLTPAIIGDITHYSINEIYSRFKGKVINSQDLAALLSSRDIEDTVRAQTLEQGYKIPQTRVDYRMNAEGELCCAIISERIRKMIQAEIETFCADGHTFRYIDGERDIRGQWEVAPDIEPINFVMKIDRIDSLPDDSLRFIDYKTGKDSLQVGKTLENLFSGDHSRQGIFQLMLYAEAYKDMVSHEGNIYLDIHSFNDITKSGKITNLTIDGKPLPPFPELSDQFRPLLEDTVSRIFDSNTPFTQCEDANHCGYCNFKQLCAREVKTWEP